MNVQNGASSSSLPQPPSTKMLEIVPTPTSADRGMKKAMTMENLAAFLHDDVRVSIVSRDEDFGVLECPCSDVRCGHRSHITNPVYDERNNVFIFVFFMGVLTTVPCNMPFEIRPTASVEQAHDLFDHPMFAAAIVYTINFLVASVNSQFYTGNMRARVISSFLVLTVGSFFEFWLSIVARVSHSSLSAVSFFWICLIMKNSASSIILSTMSALLTRLSDAYTSAYIIGTYTGIIFMVVEMMTFMNYEIMKITEFFLSVAGLSTFAIVTSYNEYYCQETDNAIQMEVDHRNYVASVSDIRAVRKPYAEFGQLLIMRYPQLLNLFVVSMVTTAVCVGILPNVDPSNGDGVKLVLAPTTILVYKLVTLATFNIGAIIGVLLFCVPSFQIAPSRVKYNVALYCMFVPLALLCNYCPEHYTRSRPVVFDNAFEFRTLVLLFGMSTGFLLTTSIVHVRLYVHPWLKTFTSMLGGLAIAFGTLIGILCCIFLPNLIIN